MSGFCEVRALVVKLRGDDSERPWVAACMAVDTYDLIDGETWREWRDKALAIEPGVSEGQDYDVREVTIRVSQDHLDALFAAVDGEVVT